MGIKGDGLMIQDMIANYAESFPFNVFPEEEIREVESMIGVSIPLIVRNALATIGEGNYWLTGQFFLIDKGLEITLGTRESIHSLNANGEHNRLKAEEFDFERSSYQESDSELVIGSTDDLEFFIDCTDSPDPLVYCHLAEVGVLNKTRSFSDVLKGFRYFERPRDLPQYLVDFHWFEKNIGFNGSLNMDLQHRMVKKWIAAGRTGMPINFKDHPECEVDLELGDESVFSPAYLQ